MNANISGEFPGQGALHLESIFLYRRRHLISVGGLIKRFPAQNRPISNNSGLLSKPMGLASLANYHRFSHYLGL
jgi:hypothetical protein